MKAERDLLLSGSCLAGLCVIEGFARLNRRRLEASLAGFGKQGPELKVG